MVFKANFEQMDILEDLLPGIEEYISNVLAGESLSPEAEDQRQYFVERLDIIKLPPSIPPRPKNLVVQPVQLYPVQDTFQTPDTFPSLEQEDFAAYQREISRALVTSDSGSVASLLLSDVKVYDDIEPKDGIKGDDTSHEDDSMYEIPQLNRTLSDSGYEKAIDISSVSKPDSIEDGHTKGPPPPSPVPPPLPPRGDRNMSDSASRGSIGSLLEDKSLDVTGKLNILNREFSVASQPEKRYSHASEKSSDDMLDEFTDQCDGGSIDSLDSSSCQDNSKTFKKPGLKLPKPIHKKKKRHRKVGESLSATLWEVSQPFRKLNDISLSGDLHYRSKLSWTKKLAALSNGRMVCYKPDKVDSRPSFVILLNGYQATFQKREGKRGFEIQLCHNNLESYLFLADFQEWAEIWCEHINSAAEGLRIPGMAQHLARGTVIESLGDGNYSLGKAGRPSSTSNLSTASSDGFDSEPGTVKVKKIDQSGIKTARMGAFAYKATQFFESFGKKSSKNTPFSERGFKATDSFRMRSASTGATPKRTPLFDPKCRVTPDSGITESPQEVEVTRHIKCQGFLDIYSSFNKRCWGKRWCMVQDNNFECYRTRSSDVCELEFLLRKCILRRAIEETKSQLGLMLLEDDREKITVEPVDWDEMGAWLRVLMKETSTPAIPEGLESFMVDMHPYVEATETCRLSDPLPGSPETCRLSDPLPGSPMTCVTSPDITSSNTTSDCANSRNTPRRQNCDSGNYSAGSFDGCFKHGSLERHTIDVHPNVSDLSLQRVHVNDNGDLYTQIRKSCTPTSPVTDSRITSSTADNSNLNFENSGSVSSFQPEDSMMDEILSKFSSQISGGFLLDDEVDTENSSNMNDEISGIEVCKFITNDTCESENNLIKSKSVELQELDSLISPIKGISNKDKSSELTDDSFLCSSFVEQADDACNNGTSDQKVDKIHHPVDVSNACGKCDENSNDTSENISEGVKTSDSSVKTDVQSKAEDKHSTSLLENNPDIVDQVDNIVLENEQGSVDSVEKDINGNTNSLDNAHVITDNILSQEIANTNDHVIETGHVTNLEQSARSCTQNGDNLVTNLDQSTESTGSIQNADNHVTNLDQSTESSIQHADNHVTNLDQSTVSCTQNGDNHVTSIENMTTANVPNSDNVMNISAGNVKDCSVVVQRNPSSAKLRELEGAELLKTMEELRVKLVQLKKDRISIRDRKQQTTSETDRDFLEAEFDRLNRECLKVSDEISYLEGLGQAGGTENKNSNNVCVDANVDLEKLEQ